MSSSIWLLVENIDKTKYPAFEIISVNSEIHQNIRTGNILTIPEHRNGSRKVIVQRISDDKKALKKFKEILEMETETYSSSVADWVESTRKRETYNTNSPHASTPKIRANTYKKLFRTTLKSRIKSEDSDSSSSSSEEKRRRLNQLVKELKNYSHKAKTFKVRKRSKLPRRSLPTRKTVDQGTQTDAAGLTNIIDHDKATALLRKVMKLAARLEKNWEDLLSRATIGVRESSNEDEEPAQFEVPIVQEQDFNILEAWSAAETKPKKAAKPEVRMVPEETINNCEPKSCGNWVPLGSGYAVVPESTLCSIDWNCYTTATRKLLQAVFPREMLATHSLTGKKSPAFLNKPAKQCLDPDVVADIVTTVMERCGVTERMVRNMITLKCTDEAKLRRIAQRRNVDCSQIQAAEDVALAPEEDHKNVETDSARQEDGNVGGGMANATLWNDGEEVVASRDVPGRTVPSNDAAVKAKVTDTKAAGHVSTDNEATAVVTPKNSNNRVRTYRSCKKGHKST